MKTIIVNRWKCQHLENAEVVALVRRGEFSRLALCEWDQSHLGLACHMPDECERSASLRCIGYLCATGVNASQKMRWVLEYIFPSFNQKNKTP